MNAAVHHQLREEVAAWAAETRTFIAACSRLIEYFGEGDELARWEAAVAAPLDCVAVVVAHVPSEGDESELVSNAPPSPSAASQFHCCEATARVISPLIEIVGVPVADFVYTIREQLPKALQAKYVRPYGYFCLAFADAVTQPVWRAHRHLAPEEWQEVFPDKG